MKQFTLMSGLPRSGSTVLCAILNQHPSIYATPTRPLLDLLVANQNAWHANPSVKANPFPDQLTNMTKGMIQGAWAHRPEPIIIDKNRGWGANLPAVKVLFGRDLKIIVTIRDLPSIMASWLTILNNNRGSNFHKEVNQVFGYHNDETLLAYMYEVVVKPCLGILKRVKEDTAPENVLYVRYDALILRPQATLAKIEDFIGITHTSYDFTNIVSNTVDDDLAAFGFNGLHTIRPMLGYASSPMPVTTLGDDLFHTYDKIGREYGL